MKIETKNITVVNVNLLYARITLTASSDDAFHLVTEKEKKFIISEDGGTLTLSQLKRKKSAWIFCWHLPIKVELQIPASFKGKLEFSNKNGWAVFQNLNLDIITAQNNNGKLAFNQIKANNINGKSKNGKVVLNNIEAPKIEVTSHNGKTVLTDVNTETLQSQSNNGKVTGFNILANSIEVKSNNGKIFLDNLKANSIQLNSNNGKVSACIVGEEKEYGYDVRVRNGKSMIAGKKFTGSYIYKDKERKKQIAVNANNGSAYFVFVDSEGH